jgi:hypothetical protein
MEILHDASAHRAAEQTFANALSNGMNGNVERGKTKFYDPREISLPDVVERYEIAEEEAQPIIVVLFIEGGSHSRRHLIHETENAFAAAGDEAHCIENDPFPRESREGERARSQETAAANGEACFPFPRREKQGIELIFDRSGAYREDLVPRPEETGFPVNSVDANRHRRS